MRNTTRPTASGGTTRPTATGGGAIRLAAILGVSALLLAACDDSDSGGGGIADTPQAEVGSTFARAFNADGTDEAIDPESGDAGDLSLTANPIRF